MMVDIWQYLHIRPPGGNPNRQFSMQIAARRFDDFHLYGASAPEWKQRYVQISRGAMQSSLTEVCIGRVHLFRKVLSHRVVQQGCLPHGKVCFVMASRVAGVARMQGREVGEHSLFVLRGGQEFVLHRPAGMALLAVTFDAVQFDAFVDAQDGAAALRRALDTAVLDVPPAAMARLRADVQSMFIIDAASFDGRALEPLLLGAVVAALREGRGLQDRNRGLSAHALVDECQRVTLHHAETPPTIAELCTRLGASRRTVQDSFQKIAQTTSVDYLRSVRLNRVRAGLHGSRADEVGIGELATHWGFSQLSHFALQYKRLFGELPSQTLRAVRST